MSKENTQGSGYDYFCDNPPQKPKAEIADYVESCGINVPIRFEGLSDALQSGKPFIIRSEHPQDYKGASGIIDSLCVTQKRILLAREMIEDPIYFATDKDHEESLTIRNFILANIYELSQKSFENMLIRTSKSKIDEFVRLTRQDRKTFDSEVSFSYWEYIDGINQVIVADSAIENRYHIFSVYGNTADNPDYYYNYSIFENSKVINSNTKGKESPDLNFPNLIHFYEKIRNLPNFDACNCPVIEAVTNSGGANFLQYLKGRNFDPPTFSLTRDPFEFEAKATWVRGATPPQGMTCSTNFWYCDDGHPDSLPIEDASFDLHWNTIFSEIMTSIRKAQLTNAEDFSQFVLDTAYMHLQKSKLFRPQISIFISDSEFKKIIPEFKLITENVNQDSPQLFLDEAGITRIEDFNTKLHIISDGTTAYIQRLD